jgi:hypothetical protein
MKPFLKITTPERAEEDDFREALAQTLEEKLDILQRLREIVHDLTHEDRKGFQRVLKISRFEKS